jgi:hypothetical protein
MEKSLKLRKTQYQNPKFGHTKEKNCPFFTNHERLLPLRFREAPPTLQFEFSSHFDFDALQVP